MSEWTPPADAEPVKAAPAKTAWTPPKDAEPVSPSFPPAPQPVSAPTGVAAEPSTGQPTPSAPSPQPSGQDGGTGINFEAAQAAASQGRPILSTDLKKPTTSMEDAGAALLSDQAKMAESVAFKDPAQAKSILDKSRRTLAASLTPVVDPQGAGTFTQYEAADQGKDDPRAAQLRSDYAQYLNTKPEFGNGANELDMVRGAFDQESGTAMDRFGRFEVNALNFAQEKLQGRVERYNEMVARGADPQTLQAEAEDINKGQQYLRDRYAFLVKNMPKSELQKLIDQRQKETDAYQPGALGKVRQGERAVALGFGESVMSSLSGLARLGAEAQDKLGLGDTQGKYSWEDKFGDWLDGVARKDQAYLPTAWQAPMIETLPDGTNKYNILPTLLRGAGAMGALVGTGSAGAALGRGLGAAAGEGLGLAAEGMQANRISQAGQMLGNIGEGLSGAGQTAGLTTSMFLPTYDQYVRTAMDEGVDEKTAQAAGKPYALFSALVENFNPQLYLMNPALKGTVRKAFLDAVKKGITDPKEIIPFALKQIGEEGGKEAVENLLQSLGERATNHVVNELTGSGLNEKYTGNDIVTDAATGFILGSLASVIHTPKGLRENTEATAEAMRFAAENPEAVDHMITLGVPEKEQEAYREKVKELVKIYKGNDLGSTPTVAAAKVANTVADKNKVEQDIKENPIDKSLAAAHGDPRLKEAASLAIQVMEAKGVKEDDIALALAAQGMIEVPEGAKVTTGPDGKATITVKEAKEGEKGLTRKDVIEDLKKQASSLRSETKPNENGKVEPSTEDTAVPSAAAGATGVPIDGGEVAGAAGSSQEAGTSSPNTETQGEEVAPQEEVNGNSETTTGAAPPEGGIGEAGPNSVPEEVTLTKDVPNDQVSLASAYLDDRESHTNESNPENIIYALTKGNVSRDSYLRFSDKNNIADGFAKHYLRKGGRSIDTIAQEASEITGREVTPDDVVEAMNANPNGRPQRSARMEELDARHKATYGKKLNALTAKKILAENKGKKPSYTPDEQAIVDEANAQGVPLEEIEDSDYVKANNIAEAEWDAIFGTDEKGGTKEQVQSGGATEAQGEVRSDEGQGKDGGKEVKPAYFREGQSSVEEATPLNDDKKAKNVEYAIPGFEDIRTVAVRGPGGWKVKVPVNEHGDEAIITSQAQGTKELAIADAAERMRRAGPEKVRALLEKKAAEAANSDQASPMRKSLERIPIDPQKGEIQEKSEMMKKLSKTVGGTVTYGKPTAKGAAGTYSPANAAVKIRYAGDLDVTSHEVGHALDDKFGLAKEVSNNLVAEDELNDLSQHGSEPPKGVVDKDRYRKAEGMAEFVRAMIVNPEATAEKYPELTKVYNETVPEATRKSIRDFGDGVRALAAADGRDIILNNIQTDPRKSKVKVLKDLFAPEDPLTMSFADKLMANWVNPLHAFTKAINYANDIRGTEKLDPSKDPYLLSRLLLHINGKTSEILESGMIDSKNQPILDKDGKPMTLKWLLEPFDNTSEHTIEEEKKDAAAYMVAERTLELSKKLGRDNILTGIGAGLFSDVDVAKKALDQFNNGDPDKLARIKEGANRYRQMANATLEYMRDKGRISQEQYEQVKFNNLQYVALNRIMESAPGQEVKVFGKGGKLASVSKPVHAIQGSSRTIKDPYSSLMDGIHKSVKEADRNEVMKTFTDLLRSDRQMYEGETLPYSKVGTMGKAGDKNSITVFNDGKPETWVFQKDVYEALKGLDNEGYKLPGVVRALPTALRWTVTHFPVFAARNIARDLQSRLISTTDHSTFKDLVGDHKHWHEVARAGGLNSGYYMKDEAHYYGLQREAMAEMAKNKKSFISDPYRRTALWRHYENLLYNSETVNRVAEYRAAFRNGKKQGMDDYNAQLYAAFKSSDLIDFALAGHHAKVMNQVVPFTNAMIQGLRSGVIHAKQDPSGFGLRMALYSVLPSVLLWYLNHQDDDQAKEYEQLPAYQRDMFYNLKVGDNQWMSIPKPFELGLTGAAVDRMLSQQFAGKKDAFEGYGGSVASSLLPDESAMAGPFKGAIENTANYDFFRKKPIVPPDEERLALDLRKTEGASRMGKRLQDTFGMDARKWDHLIESQFSYFGKTAVKLSDLGRDDSRNKFDTSDLGFFKGTPAYNSAIVTKVVQYANQYGLTSSREYKSFKAATSAYFDAKTDKDKEKAAQVLIEKAEAMYPILQKAGEEKVKNKDQPKGSNRVKRIIDSATRMPSVPKN